MPSLYEKKIFDKVSRKTRDMEALIASASAPASILDLKYKLEQWVFIDWIVNTLTEQWVFTVWKPLNAFLMKMTIIDVVGQNDTLLHLIIASLQNSFI